MRIDIKEDSGLCPKKHWPYGYIEFAALTYCNLLSAPPALPEQARAPTHRVTWIGGESYRHYFIV